MPPDAEKATIVDEDLEFVTQYYEMPDEEVEVGRISPWLLRFELDREAMSDKNLSLEDITRKIEEVYDANTLHVICNDDNAEKLVMRVRLVNDTADKGGGGGEDEEDDCHFLKKLEHDM